MNDFEKFIDTLEFITPIWNSFNFNFIPSYNMVQVKYFWEEEKNKKKDGWREKDTFNGFSLELFCNWKRKEMLVELQ